MGESVPPPVLLKIDQMLSLPLATDTPYRYPPFIFEIPK